MILTAPVIYSLILPIALVDIWVMAYQAICFPLYKIPKVRRRDYLVFDRHHLAYLNILEKINCAYCSYANGAIAFVREVASRTEVYWCPIKHARRVLGPHPHYQGFADFGDAEGFREKLEQIKDGVKIEGAGGTHSRRPGHASEANAEPGPIPRDLSIRQFGRKPSSATNTGGYGSLLSQG